MHPLMSNLSDPKLFNGSLFVTESRRHQAVTAVSAEKGACEKCSLTAKMGLTFSSSVPTIINREI